MVERRDEMISVDTFITNQVEGKIFYTVEDDIITGRGTDDLGRPAPYHHREVYDETEG
jgi:hypothetical protein